MIRKIGFCAFLISSALILILSAANATAQTVADLTRKLERLNAYPDLIVVNGKIHTMDAKLSQVEAMAVRDHRILAVGTSDEIRQLAGPKTTTLDAKGRTITPGLIDSHTHPHVWAAEHWLGAEGDFAAKKYNDPEMQIVYAKGNDGVEVLRSLERLVMERAKAVGPGKWIWIALFGGKDISESRKIVWPLFQPSSPGASGTITRELLDTLAPNNPLLVFASEAIGPETHNTKAKEEMVKILGYEAGGLNARSAVPYDIFFRGRTEDAIDFLKRELTTCVIPQGITTFANHYYGTPSVMKLFRTLQERAELPVRWAWWEGTLWGNQLNGRSDSMGDNGDMRFFYRNVGDFRGIGNDYIWNAGVSNEAWETGLSCTIAKPLKTAAVSGQGSNILDIVSGLRPDCSIPIEYEKLGGFKNVRAALDSGLRIGFLHAYSEGTYQALLQMIDQEIASGRMTLDQVRALRISTEHNPIMRPDQVKKLAQYNIMPGFNGYQVQGDIKGGAFLKAYGEQYMTWLAPMKSFVDAGGHPVFNTDSHLYKVPIWSKDMDYPAQWDGNIWAYIEFFVTRRMPGGVIVNGAEKMDRNTMMKAATIWGAEQVLNEKNIGSLEPGKLADFIVLDKDFFSIPEDQIHTIKTLLTVVGGKEVYRDAGY